MTASSAAQPATPAASAAAGVHVRVWPRESHRSAWLARTMRLTVRPVLDIATLAGEIAVASAGPEALRSAPVRVGFRTPDMIADLLPAPAGTTVEPVTLPGCRAEWVQAHTAAANRVVVHLHGGALVAGGMATHRHLAAGLSANADARVLNVDYRMAPSHEVSDSVHDALAAYRHVLDLGIPASRVVLCGDSAGGALALLAARAAATAGLPGPAAIVCISPWSDLNGPEGPPDLPDAYVPARGLRLIADAFVKLDGELSDELALHRADLTGLPPTLIHAGGYEALSADARALAERLHAAGVDVQLHIWEEQVHVFHALGFLPEAKSALAHIGEFVKRHTTGRLHSPHGQGSQPRAV